MDVRHPLKDIDRQVLGWCHAAGLPTHVLLTKADKLKRGPAKNALLEVRKQLATLHPDASVQLFSSLNRDGVEQVQAVLDDWLEFAEEAQE
jgi:GTP-binding protein